MEHSYLDDMGIILYSFRSTDDKGKPIEMPLTDIEKLNTPMLNEAMHLYHNFKVFGLPHGHGWLAERQIVLDILSILEDETNAFDSWEMKRNRS